MKNKRIVITATNLNNAVNYATTIESNGYIDYTGDMGVVQRLYPREIQIINGTGTEIEILLLGNPEEEAEYDANQTNFDFIRIPDSTTYNRILPARCWKILVRKNTFGTVGTASVNLAIELLNYGQMTVS